MSFNKSKSSSTQQSNSQSQQELDPDIKAGLLGNVQRAQGVADSYQPYTGQRVADFNPNQTNAQGFLQDFAYGNVGSGLLDQAQQAIGNATNYRPPTIASQQIGGQPGVSAQQVATPQQIQAQQISAGQLANTDLSKYMDPYNSAVVDTSNADIARQRDIALNQSKQKSLAAGSWGGTGAAVGQGLLDDNYTRAIASNTANLRSQGYTQALGAAQQDIAGRNSAAQSNQGADLQAQGLNQSGYLSAAQGNQQADLTGQQANQSSNMQRLLANQGADLTAQQNNQTAAIQPAQLGLQAAGLLSGLSDQQRAQRLQDLGLLGGVGDAQQAQSQKQIDAAKQAQDDYNAGKINYQQLINQSFGLLGNPILGNSSSTSTGSSTGSTTGFTVPVPG